MYILYLSLIRTAKQYNDKIRAKYPECVFSHTLCTLGTMKYNILHHTSISIDVNVKYLKSKIAF